MDQMDSGLDGARAWIIARVGPVAASFAGAVLSLAFLETLTLCGRIMAVLVGFATAIFIAPIAAAALLHYWPWLGPVQNGVHFFVSLSAMGVLPALLGWMRGIFGDPLSLISSLLKTRSLPTSGGQKP